MSVLVPSFPSATNTSHHYFSNTLSNGNSSQSIKHMSLTKCLTSKLTGDSDNDHVPYGVVNSMKQRLLDKVNESLLLNPNSTLIRYSLSKPSSRVASNENLLQTKPMISPLKRTTRLSRSQDSLLNHTTTEHLTSYLQPKEDMIIVDTTTTNDENLSIHRHSYTDLPVDEVPKPGTVTTVKNMFERQIRLSRFDSDKLPNTSAPAIARVNNHHREVMSPNRSRSISPNDMALRQRRIGTIPASSTPSTTSLLLSVPTSYPDLVISHTLPIEAHMEMNKPSNEQAIINPQNENQKQNIPSNETTPSNSEHNRPNLFLSSTSPSDIVDYQPIDFKSRLALFNHTNAIERSTEHSSISLHVKKPSNHPQSTPMPNFLTKPIVHRHHHTERKEMPSDDIARSLVNTTKAVTFFGGTKVNETMMTNLSASIVSPPPPIMKEEQSSVDFLHAPDVIGGNVRLSKSSMFSGVKKDTRVQFIDNVHTFEYPSFDIVMTEYDETTSDDDDSSTNDNNRKQSSDEHQNDQIEDDELEQLANVNATFNTNNLTEKPLQPKGTLHTFRPTHLHDYELGTQHGSLTYTNASDIFSRETQLSSSNHSFFKQQKSPFDMTNNNIQWSSMSTTTDLLF